MKRLFNFILLAAFIVSGVYAQKVKELDSPKLVVGIVVDQMRWDYLTRFYERYGEGGFRRLMSEGYNCNRLEINYIPAVTAAGHTSVYTGSVPAFTGIIANDFPVNGEWGTSVSDKSVKPVGTDSKRGMASPRKLMVTTITDELRMATNFRSKTIGVALKDRAAILPAGRSANAAYWYDASNGNFVTSSYYMQDLPGWVKDFNAKGYSALYTKKLKEERVGENLWKLMYDEKSYVQSTPNKKEGYFADVPDDITFSPYGITLTADMAIAAMEGENMGCNKFGVPDFLAISFSSTDMLGHRLGTNAIWIEDMYLRLDREIARILNTLDSKVGKGEYVIFLTADHAGAHNVEFRKEHGINAEAWTYYKEIPMLRDSLKSHFHTDKDLLMWYACYNNDVYFDNKAIDSIAIARGMEFKELKQQVMDYTKEYLEKLPYIAYCYEFRNIPSYIPEPIRTKSRNGYNPKRSGELQIVLEVGVTEDYEEKDFDGLHKGTNHTIWGPDDAHIPFIVMGKNIPHSWDNSRHNITDIAATMASVLNVQQPSGCVGESVIKQIEN